MQANEVNKKAERFFKKTTNFGLSELFAQCSDRSPLKYKPEQVKVLYIYYVLNLNMHTKVWDVIGNMQIKTPPKNILI